MWAPWRTKYVAGEREKECFLCRVLSESKDDENFVLHRGATHFIVLNIYPYNNGHLMVSPNRHVKEVEQLVEAELLEMMKLSVRAVQALRIAIKPQGFNTGLNLGFAAGAGLEDHLHLHVVPRWQGDTNFMPVMADVKVVSQHLQETYALLKAAWVKTS